VFSGKFRKNPFPFEKKNFEKHFKMGDFYGSLGTLCGCFKTTKFGLNFKASLDQPIGVFYG